MRRVQCVYRVGSDCEALCLADLHPLGQGQVEAYVAWPFKPAQAQVPGALVDADNPKRSVKLRVMADSDGSYIVRPWQAKEKTITFVPRASVAQLDECP